MCNAAGTDSSVPPAPAPPLGSFKASARQLLRPVDGDDAGGHALQLSKVAGEARAIGRVSVPMAITGLVMYSRALISMLFLGRLGELALAGGSLALGFANITGYSMLSGLALGMEPICGQAFGVRRGKLPALALHRTVLLLLAVALPISLLWVTSTGYILKLLGQDEGVADAAQTFAAYASADLAVLAVLHPLRIYLRSQNLTLPITACSLFSVLLHGPINYLLVVRLDMGVAGVALAVALTDLNLLLALLCFLAISGAHRDSWVGPTSDCLRGWPALLRLAVPTATAVCLEWWWYELMIVLSGLLANPRATVASMGILIQATSLVYVFPSSLGQGASTRVSHQLGAGRPAGARRAAGAALSIGVAVGLAAAAFMVSVRNHWGRMFTSDADILRLTAVALPIAGLCELGNCPQTAGCGVLRGSARPASGARINLASFYLVGMPVGVALAFGARLGFAGLWLGLLAAQAACAVWMARAVAATDWDVEVARAKELTKASSTGNNNHSECNATTTSASDITIVIATITTGATSNSNAAVGCNSNNNGYVPISESCGGNDNELEKLEAGLMSSASDDSGNGDASSETDDAVVRENHGSGSGGNSNSCCDNSGAAGTTATEGKEQRRDGSERAPLISVGDGEHDGDGRGGGQV
ncbi:Protein DETOXIFICATION 48 [Dichanthelium oligosanthes]|uniref:Protein DETOXIFICATION n=1 Tax=Dichanthelium oligosanthes TaxID=888268 RepID=A0A1E5VW98_9POAL|nr:Protein DETOXIFICATION 48 [Dichanthelium oligosanthes]